MDQDGDGATDLQDLIKRVTGGGGRIPDKGKKACLIKISKSNFFGVLLTGTPFFWRLINVR